MPNNHSFDVALSFAGEHRKYVAEVAERLRKRGFTVFFDEFERVSLLGRNLVTYLQDVYSHRSAVVAAFISQEWVTKPWTGHERETALAHALLHSNSDLPFLLPFRFDDTPVPGLQRTVAYDDLRQLHSGERRWRKDPRYKHPQHVVDLLTRILNQRGLGVPPDEDEDEDGDMGVQAILAWVAHGGCHKAVGLVFATDYEEGETEIYEGEAPDGPATGRYLLLPQELGVPMNPTDAFPVFLHDTYTAYEKTWILPVSESGELAAVDIVRRTVQEAVDLEIAQGAVPLGPTFTRTLQTPYGLAVHGMCVVGRPTPPAVA